MIPFDWSGPQPSALALQIGQIIAKPPPDPTQPPVPRFPEVRARVGELVANAVLDAYQRGEMGAMQALTVVDLISLRLPGEFHVSLVGQAAIRMLSMPAPKDLNRSKPPYPSWIKTLAVDLTLFFQEGYGDLAPMSAKAARYCVSGLILGLGLIVLENGRGRILSEATLRKWCAGRLRETGKTARRGRPRKKK